MKPVKTEATTVVEKGWPYHLFDDEGMTAIVTEWEFEAEDWDTWERSRDRLITLAAYPDGTYKMMASALRKAE